MAKRNTFEEAQDLKKKLEENNPGAVIIINEIPGDERMVFPGAIEAQGLQDKVVRWEDHPSGQKYPVVQFDSSYEVLEQKTCSKCGKDWQTAAIGELNQLCSNCQDTGFPEESGTAPYPSEWELRDGRPE